MKCCNNVMDVDYRTMFHLSIIPLFHLREMAINKLLVITAVGEAFTGVVLLVYPPIVIRLLFGAEIAGAGIVTSRIAGISLIALGLACLPNRDAGSLTPALRGMLTYSLFATLYLFYLGIAGDLVGILLWPAIVLHAVLTILLARRMVRGDFSKSIACSVTPGER